MSSGFAVGSALHMYAAEAIHVCELPFRAARGRVRPRCAAESSHAGNDRGRAAQHVALRGPPSCLVRIAGRPRDRVDATDPRRPPRRRDRPRRGLGEGRHRQPDGLVQGPSCRRGAHEGPRARVQRCRCASTGNLANSVAAHAARAGMESFVFVPHDLEAVKLITTAVFGGHLVAVDGSYDDVNRLCAELASESADLGLRERQHPALLRRRFEDAGLRGRGAARLAAPGPRRCPDRGPEASSTKIDKGFRELTELGLVDGDHEVRISGVQARGRSPVATVFVDGADHVGCQARDDRRNRLRSATRRTAGMGPRLVRYSGAGHRGGPRTSRSSKGSVCSARTEGTPSPKPRGDHRGDARQAGRRRYCPTR